MALNAGRLKADDLKVTCKKKLYLILRAIRTLVRTD